MVYVQFINNCNYDAFKTNNLCPFLIVKIFQYTSYSKLCNFTYLKNTQTACEKKTCFRLQDELKLNLYSLCPNYVYTVPVAIDMFDKESCSDSKENKKSENQQGNNLLKQYRKK